MQYLKNVMESEGVQTLVNEHDELINVTINNTIKSIVDENINIAKINLDSFVTEGDLLETYEDISTWASNDVQEYLEAVSEVLSDNELTQEDKLEILEAAPNALKRSNKNIVAKMKDGYKRGSDKGTSKVGKVAKGVIGAGGAAARHIRQKYTRAKGKFQSTGGTLSGLSRMSRQGKQANNNAKQEIKRGAGKTKTVGDLVGRIQKAQNDSIERTQRLQASGKIKK
jgi:hypothetical protein